MHGKEQADWRATQARRDAWQAGLLLPRRRIDGSEDSEGQGARGAQQPEAWDFANRILDEEERETFDAIVARVQSDFSLNDSSDTIAVEALAMACLRLSRAIKADDADAAERWDRIVRSHLKDLKATKIVREGEGKPLGTSPADWATALLEELRSVNKAARRRQKRAEKAKGDATDGD